MTKEELTVGTRIKMLREISNYSQEKLAERICVSSKTVSSWETGERDITLPNVKALSEVFGVPEPFILYGYEDQLDRFKKTKIEEYLVRSEKVKLINQMYDHCKEKMSKDGIEFSKDYLPKYDSKTCVITDGGIFDMESLPLIEIQNERFEKVKMVDVENVDDKDCYKYDIHGLSNYGLYSVVKRLFDKDVKLTDLVDSDDMELFDLAMNNVLHNKHKEVPSYWGREKSTYEYDGAFKVKELNDTLEYLNPELNNFWHFIIKLIDNGAVYMKQYEYGSGDYCNPQDIKDVSKTNLVYRIAKDHIKYDL